MNVGKMLSAFLEVRPIFAFCRGKISSLLQLRHVLPDIHRPQVPDRLLTDGQCRMRINGVLIRQSVIRGKWSCCEEDYPV